jgi:hypothetical protein
MTDEPFLDSASATATPAKSGAERRRDKRYEVDLPGFVELDSTRHAVVISDLSAGGALITSNVRFQPGAMIALTIEEFGVLDAKIVHSGTGFAGLQFMNAHLHRDRLAAWLRTEARQP